MLVTDISGSMNATDVSPTRLAAAQKSANEAAGPAAAATSAWG